MSLNREPSVIDFDEIRMRSAGRVDAGCHPWVPLDVRESAPSVRRYVECQELEIQHLQDIITGLAGPADAPPSILRGDRVRSGA